MCNKTDFTFIRDYGLERYLKSCEVWCSKKKDGCEWRGKLGGFEQHLKDDCPLTKVSCPLHYAGCEVELPRKDMPEHMKDTVTHLALLANVTLSLMKENLEKQKEVDVLKEEIQKLRLTVGGFPIDFKLNYASKEEVPSFYTHSQPVTTRVPHNTHLQIVEKELMCQCSHVS